jgi:hypothetical protein
VSSGLLLDKEMVIPPAGAAVFKVARHVELWPPLRVPGSHAIEERAGTATIPPEALSARAEPVAATPDGFDMPMENVVALAASVIWTLATTPVAMTFAFRPVITQIAEPAATEHVGVFPATVAAGPAVMPIAET